MQSDHFVLIILSDATFADMLLQHAKELYDFAQRYPGKYSDSVSAASGYYR